MSLMLEINFLTEMCIRKAIVVYIGEVNLLYEDNLLIRLSQKSGLKDYFQTALRDNLCIEYEARSNSKYGYS